MKFLRSCFLASVFFTQVDAAVTDSIVFIKVKKIAYPVNCKQANPSKPFHDNGTGIIVSQEGHVLTNNALIGEATSAEINTNDQTKYNAVVIARDLITDLALLEIKTQNKKFKPIKFASSTSKGEPLFIVGAPYGLAFSVAQSLVSEYERPANSLPAVRSYYGNAMAEFAAKLIQYDLATPYGYGSVLFNEMGECVGLGTCIYDELGLYGVRFALTVQTLKKAAQDMIKHKKVLRGYLGVAVQNIDVQLAQAHNLSQAKLGSDVCGVAVVELKPNCVTKLLKTQDVICKINGKLIGNADQFAEMILQSEPESVMILDVWRKENGQYAMHKVSVKPGQMEVAKPSLQVNESNYLNLQLIALKGDDKLTKVLRQVSGNISSGLIISAIDDAFLAHSLKVNDVILKINNIEVHDLKAFDAAIADSLKKNEKYIILLIARKDQIFSYAIEVSNVMIKDKTKEGK